MDANDAVLNGAGGEVPQFLSDWASASWNLGLVLDWPRLHFLHCVAVDYVCCGCMQEMNTKCVHIKLIKLIKRFVLES